MAHYKTTCTNQPVVYLIVVSRRLCTGDSAKLAKETNKTAEKENLKTHSQGNPIVLAHHLYSSTYRRKKESWETLPKQEM